ncbi:MAG: dTDP-4-dehydrorhamnose 3,5-epimerase family protein, partial [Erythrobacter sp.]
MVPAAWPSLTAKTVPSISPALAQDFRTPMLPSVTATELPGVLLVTPARHMDARGFFEESWSARDFPAIGIAAEFVQDNHSLSRMIGTLRGLNCQARLRACLPNARECSRTTPMARALRTYSEHRKDGSGGCAIT